MPRVVQTDSMIRAVQVRTLFTELKAALHSDEYMHGMLSKEMPYSDPKTEDESIEVFDAIDENLGVVHFDDWGFDSQKYLALGEKIDSLVEYIEDPSVTDSPFSPKEKMLVRVWSCVYSACEKADRKLNSKRR